MSNNTKKPVSNTSQDKRTKKIEADETLAEAKIRKKFGVKENTRILME
jgi:hypothetical protein